MINSLEGKFLSFNGDSLCAGAGCRGGYGKIIAERSGARYENLAIGGATVVVGQYHKNGNVRHCICRTVDDMDADADYAIIEGGVNDASICKDAGPASLPFGKISDGYTGPYDETSFCGAFEAMLLRLTKRFAGKKYGYIAVHQMTDKYRACYTGEDNFYLAAKTICAKWGVPFLDLNVSCPPFAYFPKDDGSELAKIRENHTKDGDGWHPNAAGYEKYYCDKIEAWLKSL